MKILYLEDFEPDAKLIQRYMNSVNHQFTLVNSIDTAAAALQNDPPDIFLVDIVIDSEDSYELVEYAVRNQLAKYVIAVTAKSLPAERQYCIDIGCAWVISKPFTIDELEAVLEQCY